MKYKNCKFCGGRGCLACEQQREKDAKAAMEPIFVADPNSPSDMELLKNAMGAEAIEKAVITAEQNRTTVAQELIYNLSVASVLQFMRSHSSSDEADEADDKK